MTSPPSPPPLPPGDGDRLLDLGRGELAGRARRKLEARLTRDPLLQAEARRVQAFVRAVQGARDPAPDPEAALRVALQIRDRVRDEETAVRRDALRSPAPRALRWARLLAFSVAAHVLVLGVVGWRMARQSSERRGDDPQARLALPVPGLADEAARDEEERALVWPASPRPGLSDLPDAAGPRVPVDREELDLVPLRDAARDHPREVALEMAVRRFDVLKRRRLDRYGLDATGTLKAVARGLEALEKRQREDGSFPASEGRSALGQTALALLPFLAEGEGSRTGAQGPRVVGRGSAWLRRTLFGAGGLLEDEGAHPANELGMALRALAEDYMVSFGRLLPADARRRGEELRCLSAALRRRQGKDGAFPRANEDVRFAVWPMWGLEAAIRTGAVAPPREVRDRFQSWYATAEGSDPHVVAAGLLLSRDLDAAFAARADEEVQVLLRSAQSEPLDPFWVAIAGSGLLLRDPVAYRAWNEEVGGRLLRGLSPTGVVWRGDAVGDTALVLLALQAAYRTY